MKKKRNIIIIGILILVIIIIALVISLNPFNLGKVKGDVSKLKPANPDFEDVNFYISVVLSYYNDSYESITDYDTYEPGFDININLTDEQLASITSLGIETSTIKSFKGIEKLVNLESIRLYDNYDVETLDLSKNEKLISINVKSGETFGNISNVILPSSIEYVQLSGLNIKTINTSDLTALEYLDLSNNNLSTIDLEKNTKLERLYLKNNNLDKIDISKNFELTNLQLSNNNLTEIDVSKNTKLTNLELADNNLEGINLENNNSLNYINISQNYISNLDISNTNYTIGYNTSYELGGNKISQLKIKNWSSDYSFNYIGEQQSSLKEISYSSGEKIKLLNNNIKFFPDGILIDKQLSAKDFFDSFQFENLEVLLCDFDYGCIKEEDANDQIVKDDAYLHLSSNEKIVDLFIHEFSNQNFYSYDFYQAIINAFNSKTGNSYTTKNVLTEEELSEITELYYYSGTKKIESFKGIEKLVNLEVLSISSQETGILNINNFDLSSLKNLKSLGLYNINIGSLNLINSTQLNQLTLYNCNLNNLNLDSNTSLTSLRITKGNFKTIDLSKNEQLSELYMNDANIENLNLGKNNLSRIEINKVTGIKSLSVKSDSLKDLSLKIYGLESLDVTECPNLEELSIKQSMLEELDLTKNTLLQGLSIEGSLIKKITGLNNVSDELEISNSKISSLEALNSELSEIEISLSEIEELDLSNNIELEYMYIVYTNLKNIKGIENLSNIEELILPFNQIEKLDLSKLSNLKYVSLGFNPFTKDNVSMIAGTEIEYNPSLKLPVSIDKDTYNEDDTIAVLEDNKIKAIKEGETTITTFISSYDTVSEEIYDMPIRMYVKVFDIQSNKYIINKEHKYIYAGTQTNDNAIKRYVKVFGDDVSKELINDKFKLLSGSDVIETYDVIKISSSKYNLDGDVINYSGNLDLNKIDVTNAELVVIEDELQIVHDGIIVKTLKLNKGGK